MTMGGFQPSHLNLLKIMDLAKITSIFRHSERSEESTACFPILSENRESHSESSEESPKHFLRLS